MDDLDACVAFEIWYDQRYQAILDVNVSIECRICVSWNRDLRTTNGLSRCDANQQQHSLQKAMYQFVAMGNILLIPHDVSRVAGTDKSLLQPSHPLE